MEKRGLSTVIATVLTVLLSLAAVVVLWASVEPILSSSVTPVDPQLRFSIDKVGSYTLYDTESGYLSLQVKRGADNDQPPVIALKFVLDIGGNSESRQTYNVMPPNHAIVYYLLIGFNVPLNSVKLVPIYLINGGEVEGDPIDLETRIPIKPGALKEKIGEVTIAPDPETPVTDDWVLYYSFDEDYVTATQILDQSGAGHAGTLNGQIQLIQENGREFATFDGAGDFVSLADGQRLADVTGDEKTIAFWARFNCPIDAANTNQVPFGSYENYYVLFVDPCQQFVNTELRINYDFPPATPRTFTSEDIWSDLSGWEFFTIVLDAVEGELRIYRNGELADMQAGMTLASSNPSPDYYVGTSSDASGGPNEFSYFKGSLDELRVYDRVLSIDEIQELYAMNA